MSETINPDVAAARHALGIATPAETDLLTRGDRVHTGAPSTGGANVPIPSTDQAAWTLLEFHISAIAHGRLEPEEGMRLVIEEVFRPARLARSTRSRLGDSHDIDRLVALQDEYDDMRRYERRNDTPDRRKVQVDAQVTLAAREWMARNATYRVG